MNDHRYCLGEFLSANASGLSGQCFHDGGYRIIALSLLGNPERETQILFILCLTGL